MDKVLTSHSPCKHPAKTEQHEHSFEVVFLANASPLLTLLLFQFWPLPTPEGSIWLFSYNRLLEIFTESSFSLQLETVLMGANELKDTELR